MKIEETKLGTINDYFYKLFLSILVSQNYKDILVTSSFNSAFVDVFVEDVRITWMNRFSNSYICPI